ncbi:unnamed protein product, partial [Ranitomeya imitator]
MPDHMIPEIKRTSLTSVILTLKCLEVNDVIRSLAVSASRTVTAGRKVKAEHSGCAFTFTLRPAVTECGKQTARDLTDTRISQRPVPASLSALTDQADGAAHTICVIAPSDLNSQSADRRREGRWSVARRLERGQFSLCKSAKT